MSEEEDERRGVARALTCAMMPGIELNFSVTISCIFAASAEPSTNSGNLKKTATARASTAPMAGLWMHLFLFLMVPLLGVLSHALNI